MSVKLVRWVVSSLRDLRAFPQAVRTSIGQPLLDTQFGRKHPTVKPLKGIGGADALEIVEDDDDGAACRAV